MILSGLILAGMVVYSVGAVATAGWLLWLTRCGRDMPPLAEGETYAMWLTFHSGFWWLHPVFLFAFWLWHRVRGAAPADARVTAVAGDADEGEDADIETHPWAS